MQTQNSDQVAVRVQILIEVVVAAAAWLERNRTRINQLNVFPVPDGDTGDNMVLTMKGAVDQMKRAQPRTVSELCDALMEGSLNGSRGNSGVILSQMISGFASKLRDAHSVATDTLATAFEEAARVGYAAHSEPVEGTMMTVARDMAEEARRRADAGDSITKMLAAVLAEARLSVVRTQSLLPRLQQAGLWTPAARDSPCFRRDRPPAAWRGRGGRAPGGAGGRLRRARSFGGGRVRLLHELHTSGEDLDVPAFKERVLALGKSALVVGNPRLIKVHVHTEQPGEILSHALSLGTLHQLKLDNMDDQYSEARQARQESRIVETVETALLVISQGRGFEQIFERDAKAHVVSGGQSSNPSTGDLIAAINACPAENVILITNNPNVIMAAERAAAESSKQVRVLPTKTGPVGVVASLAYDPSVGLDENYSAMSEAVEGVRGIEIAPAVRDATVEEVSVRKGEYLVIVDDHVVAADQSLAAALVAGLGAAGADEYELLTVYVGADASTSDVDGADEAVSESRYELTVEVHQGGQPHYPIVASLE
ncbi:MAG: DAK2 domain-containing protein [Chloroflexia bacterium]